VLLATLLSLVARVRHLLVLMCLCVPVILDRLLALGVRCP
jgi:hypothetical protein